MTDIPLTFECAEFNPHYLARPNDPRWEQTALLSERVRATKQQNPGIGIYDHLIDALISNTAALAKEYQSPSEPASWTAPQRCVWRSTTNVRTEQRYAIVNDRSLRSDIKAIVSIRQGRWIVMCPFPHCNGAQVASYFDRRFWCVDCKSRATEGKWIEVLWPAAPPDVERWLMNRPHHARNWDFGETEDDIREQDELEKVAH